MSLQAITITRWLCVMLTAMLMTGCSSIGPGTVTRDRIDYVTAVADSWKEQALLNIVRMRYGDAPSFLDVSSVISAYTVQGQFAAGAQINSDLTNALPSNSVILNGSATYLDRPTVSYTPITGDKFAKSLLRPIPPSSIFELIQAGYPADAVLQLTVRAINGVYNRSSTGARIRDADSEFYPLLDALRRLQLSGVVSLRLERRGAEEVGTLVLSNTQTPETDRDLSLVARVLRLRLEKNAELTIAFGAVARNDKEFAVLSRSMLDLLLEVGAGIEVPTEHVSAGWTVASGRAAEADNPRDRPIIRILSGATQPQSAFATVRYGNTWYWIAVDDFRSKSVFSFLMMFFALAETGVVPQVPVLTVPAS
jgi:hypothetical protein